MDILPDDARPWTFTVYLVTDAGARIDEAPSIKIGDGRLRGDHLMLDLVPGLAISGRLVLKLKD